MKESILTDSEIDIDLQGYLAGEAESDCSTEVFDLHGRRVENGSIQ